MMFLEIDSVLADYFDSFCEYGCVTYGDCCLECADAAEYATS
jgi:hypothetical protein